MLIKKLLLRKIKKNSKQDDIVCPVGMCDGEGRHRGNGFCFQKEKKRTSGRTKMRPIGRLHCLRCGKSDASIGPLKNKQKRARYGFKADIYEIY